MAIDGFGNVVVWVLSECWAAGFGVALVEGGGGCMGEGVGYWFGFGFGIRRWNFWSFLWSEGEIFRSFCGVLGVYRGCLICVGFQILFLRFIWVELGTICIRIVECSCICTHWILNRQFWLQSKPCFLFLRFHSVFYILHKWLLVKQVWPIRNHHKLSTKYSYLLLLAVRALLFIIGAFLLFVDVKSEQKLFEFWFIFFDLLGLLFTKYSGLLYCNVVVLVMLCWMNYLKVQGFVDVKDFEFKIW